MSRRLDFEKACRNHQARHGLSVKDETEWMENDAAARWLARNGSRALQKSDHRPSAQQPATSATKLPPRKRKQADRDRHDPHDHVTGADMRRIPWT